MHGVFPSSCGQPASSPALQVRRVSRQDSRTFVTPFVQVGTYPTRNFATLGPFICVNDQKISIAVGIYNPNPSCRHEDRTISSSLVCDAWRVVSEDSSLRWPFLLIICTFAFSRGDPFNPWLNKPQITRIKAGFTNFSFVAQDTQTFQHIAKFL